MKRYVLGRIIRSVISIMVVTCAVIVLVFMGVPRDRIFRQDQASLQKLASKPDELTNYRYNKWEDIGYLDFQPLSEMCTNSSDDYAACMVPGSDEFNRVVEQYEADGYTITEYETSDLVFASRDYSPLELVWNFLTSFIEIDHPNVIQDADNPDLERKIYIGSDFNGIPAVKCTGCEHEYLIYFDSSFPFIHQNWIQLNFGESYPTFQRRDTLEVISSGQGELVNAPTTFPNGTTGNSTLNLHTCTYKPTASMDRMDLNKFDTNYANCMSNYSSPSMINLSYIFGIAALVLAYLIALPAGIIMAQKKGKWQDKLGIIYVNIMISVPSLAFIFFMKLIGNSFGLPDKFPQLGFQDIRSYILPVIILALLSTASLMIWVRRYMVDQSNADYVKFARAKGLSQSEIFNRHILKNAIIPIVNGIPGQIILCISGSVITESVFAIPGMGKMLPDAIKANNNTMIVTLTFIFTALSIFSLLAGDILLTFVDPRIQLSSKGETR